MSKTIKPTNQTEKKPTLLNMEFSSLSEWLPFNRIHYTDFSNRKFLLLAWIHFCPCSHWWRANKCRNFILLFLLRQKLLDTCFSYGILCRKYAKYIITRLFPLYPVNHIRHCSPSFKKSPCLHIIISILNLIRTLLWKDKGSWEQPKKSQMRFLSLQSFQPHKHDASTWGTMRSHGLVSYCSVNTCENWPGAAGKGKTQLTSSSPQSGGIHILPHSATITDQSNSQTNLLCHTKKKSHLIHPHRSQKKFAMVLAFPEFTASHFFPTL